MKPVFYYKLRQKSTGLYFTTVSIWDVCGFGPLAYGKRFDTAKSCRSELYFVEFERKSKVSLWKKYGYPKDKTEEQCKLILGRLRKSNYEIVKFQEVEIDVVK